jgi:broad specificity phosphatase PhoE
MRLLLLRHGLTEANKAGVSQGSIDIPLNDEGRAQAQALASRLAKLKVDSIYSSTLSRAIETAQIIANSSGISNIIQDSRLVEVNFGIYEGQPYQLISQERQRNIASIYDWAPPGGESPADCARRVQSLLEEWMAFDAVLAVAHGSLNRVIRAILTGETYDLFAKQDNCCVNEFIGNKIGSMQLVRWNDVHSFIP